MISALAILDIITYLIFAKVLKGRCYYYPPFHRLVGIESLSELPKISAEKILKPTVQWTLSYDSTHLPWLSDLLILMLTFYCSR